VIGASPISAWGLRLYLCSTQAWVASFRKSKVRSGTCSSMAISRPSTGPPKCLLLGVLIGAVRIGALLQGPVIPRRAARDLLVRFPDVHDGWDRL
jgi:hypothetical protein